MSCTGTCDGCTSAADADVYLVDGRQLELCDRHARRHESALRRQGALLISHPSAFAGQYEGVAFEREFRRLVGSAADRSPFGAAAANFLRAPEHVRAAAVGSLWRRAWNRFSCRHLGQAPGGIEPADA